MADISPKSCPAVLAAVHLQFFEAELDQVTRGSVHPVNRHLEGSIYKCPLETCGRPLLCQSAHPNPARGTSEQLNDHDVSGTSEIYQFSMHIYIYDISIIFNPGKTWYSFLIFKTW